MPESTNTRLAPSTIGFERRYDDDSGVEYGVRLTSEGSIEFEAYGTKVNFPFAEREWLAASLATMIAAVDDAADTDDMERP